MPIIIKSTKADKIGHKTNYEQAESYFVHIEEDIRELRKLALEELTRNKPEKVAALKVVMILHALTALGLTTFSMFSNLNRIM